MEQVLQFLMSVEGIVMMVGLTIILFLGLLSLDSKPIKEQCMEIIEREDFEREVEKQMLNNVKKASVTELLEKIVFYRDESCPVVHSIYVPDLYVLETELLYRLETIESELSTSDAINIRLYFDDPENFNI